MKNVFSVLAVAAALGAGSGAAFAADLPSRVAAPVYVPPPVFTWTGPYVGLNLGGGWRDRSHGWWSGWTGAGAGGGVVGGLQIGYNYQVSPLFIVGLETDFQGTSIGAHNGNYWWGWGDWNGRGLPWFGTLRGRVGLAVFDSRLLIYGTGGFAYGEVRNSWSGWWGNNNNNISTGWAAGGGIEYAFLPNWSAKIEYLYTDLSVNNNNNWGWGAGWGGGWGGGWNWPQRHLRVSTVRAGVNYHFNLFTPAPVVAKF